MFNCSHGADTMHVIPSPQKKRVPSMCASPILIISLCCDSSGPIRKKFRFRRRFGQPTILISLHDDLRFLGESCFKSVPEAVQLNSLRERPKFRRGDGSSQRNQVESLQNCQVKYGFTVFRLNIHRKVLLIPLSFWLLFNQLIFIFFCLLFLLLFCDL